MPKKMNIIIGERRFAASLIDNTTTQTFQKLLPLTLSMIELNQNEKYAELPQSLPTNANNPGTIKTGDILLWGKNTLVIFYKTFTTSYSYTRIGSIDVPSQLAEVLGSGNVIVRLE
ncbi:MAG: hypothetical protein HOP30_08205 [Cyclobacteriaceae bacterium]|nr:hypothetical protein [Cyclobacteriaceae bacterium]